jgi:hypothetical protein
VAVVGQLSSKRLVLEELVVAVMEEVTTLPSQHLERQILAVELVVAILTVLQVVLE